MDLIFVDFKTEIFQTEAMKASSRTGFKYFMSYPQKSKCIEIPSLSASTKLNLFMLIFYISGS